VRQERDPWQRRQFLRRGKHPVHIDDMWVCTIDGTAVWICAEGPPRRWLGLRASTTQYLVVLAAHIDSRLEEPLLFEGTYDTVVFNAWLKRGGVLA
jgi:hypothetical protein